MEFFGVLFRHGQALALFGDNVQNDGFVRAFAILQVAFECGNVVAVDWPDIHHSDIFEHCRRQDKTLYALVDFFVNFDGGIAENFFEKLVGVGIEFAVIGVCENVVEVFRHRADVFGYRHFIVVQHDYHLFGGCRNVVECFERDAV